MFDGSSPIELLSVPTSQREYPTHKADNPTQVDRPQKKPLFIHFGLVRLFQGRRAQSLYCAIPATRRPTPSAEACLRDGAIKRLRPTALLQQKTQTAGSASWPMIPRHIFAKSPKLGGSEGVWGGG